MHIGCNIYLFMSLQFARASGTAPPQCSYRAPAGTIIRQGAVATLLLPDARAPADARGEVQGQERLPLAESRALWQLRGEGGVQQAQQRACHVQYAPSGGMATMPGQRCAFGDDGWVADLQ
jgi:hypothetical protein